MIDADGMVFRDFKNFLPRCLLGALIVVDDCKSEGAVEKAGMTKPCIDALVAAGIFNETGVFGWGTWFGTLNSRIDRTAVEAIERGAAA